MAGKKPRSKRSKRKGSSLLSRLIWGVWLFATGGGVAGWAAPDLPIVGPLVHCIIHHEAAAPQGSPSGPATVEDQFAQLHRRGSGSATDGTAAIPAAGATHDQPVSATTRLASSRKPSDTILIASFNIQVFGTSKLGKAWIVNILSQIVRQFDVVAIQEVRSKDDRILPEFVTAINADGSQYSYLIGPRLGARSVLNNMPLSTIPTALRSIVLPSGPSRIPVISYIVSRSWLAFVPARQHQVVVSPSGWSILTRILTKWPQKSTRWRTSSKSCRGPAATKTTLFCWAI